MVKLRPPEFLGTVDGWMQVCVSVSSSPLLTLLHINLSTFFSMLPSDIKKTPRKLVRQSPDPGAFPCSVTRHRRSRSDTCKAKCSPLQPSTRSLPHQSASAHPNKMIATSNGRKTTGCFKLNLGKTLTGRWKISSYDLHMPFCFSQEVICFKPDYSLC